MATATKARLISLVNELIQEGNIVIATKKLITHAGPNLVYMRPREWLDLQPYAKWRGGCLNLLRVLGASADPWREGFKRKENTTTVGTVMLGTLESIKAAIEQDLLFTVESLVMAEALSDLLEQAEHLSSKSYFLASGVLGRAVLEEHLRKWCDRVGSTPSKAKPTLNDFNTALRGHNHFTLAESKHVEAMAAIGNDAAHNKPTLKKEDVQRLIPDVSRFLAQHPLP